MALEGIPDSVFEEEPLYSGELETIGDLAQGFITNSAALMRANNKLKTICAAARRCAE